MVIERSEQYLSPGYIDAHGHHSPYVPGRDESDMALAFNRVMEMG